MGKKEGPTLDRGVWGKSLTSKMLTLNLTPMDTYTDREEKYWLRRNKMAKCSEATARCEYSGVTVAVICP
jgi:hypothetical protein